MKTIHTSIVSSLVIEDPSNCWQTEKTEEFSVSEIFLKIIPPVCIWSNDLLSKYRLNVVFVNKQPSLSLRTILWMGVSKEIIWN